MLCVFIYKRKHFETFSSLWHINCEASNEWCDINERCKHCGFSLRCLCSFAIVFVSSSFLWCLNKNENKKTIANRIISQTKRNFKQFMPLNLLTLWSNEFYQLTKNTHVMQISPFSSTIRMEWQEAYRMQPQKRNRNTLNNIVNVIHYYC